MIHGAAPTGGQDAVIMRVTGGLGNQLFQYAMGRALALRHDVPLLLDLSHYTTPGPHTARSFELDKLNTCYAVATEEDLRPFRASWMRKLLERLDLKPSPRLIHQPGFGFSPSLLASTPPVYLDGTWQSEKYFAYAAARLREELTLGPGAGSHAALSAKESGKGVSVSVHIRRGDYATDPRTKAYHGLLDLSYYAGAMRAVLEFAPTSRFLVFSDDPDWAREHLTSPAPLVFMDQRPATVDLMLMAQCDHHIIANSSFSWWGAWLNPATTKRVMAPARWFVDPAIDTTDLIPAGWTRC